MKSKVVGGTHTWVTGEDRLRQGKVARIAIPSASVAQATIAPPPMNTQFPESAYDDMKVYIPRKRK